MTVHLPGVRRLLALLVLPLAAASARGQGLPPPGGGGGTPTTPHYEVTYTMGTWHSSGLNGSTQGSFDGGGYSVQTGGVGVPPGATAENPPGSGTADAEGPITAHFNWVPAGDTSYPPAVVVKEVVTASYSHVGGGTGHCATGLGAHGLSPAQYGDSVTDVRYSVKQSPGASFSLPASVSPTADVIQPGGFGSAAGSCGVSYVVTATPVTINLTGSIEVAGHSHILVGQQLNFALNAGGYNTASDSYAWSISDGNPFRFYFEGSHYASKTSWTPVQTANDFCYFAKYVQGGATLTCTTYLASIGQSVTVTKDVSVDKPSCQVGVGIGVSDTSVSQVPFASTNRTSSANYFTIWGGDVGKIDGGGSWFGSAPSEEHPGFVITAVVETPPLYSGQGSGEWQYVQHVVPSRSIVDGSGTHQFTANGWSCLDTYLPYDQQTTSAEYDHAPEHMTNDSPANPITTPITQTTIHDSFHMYVMYLPPSNGLGSNHVPLSCAGWYWGIQATWNAGLSTWNVTPAQSWGFLPPFPDHPEWSHNVTDGHF